MDPVTVFALISGSARLIAELTPVVQRLQNGETISPSEQAELRAKYEALRIAGDTAFSGPEWEVKP